LSSIGCEYWTIKLPNTNRDNETAHAVVVTNVSSSQPVEVSIFDSEGRPVDVFGWETTIGPGEQRVFEFDPSAINRTNIEPIIPDPDYISGTVIGNSGAFRLVSSHPTIMHQYNPFRPNFSSDASLLLPVDALGSEYRSMSWLETWQQFGPNRSGFTTILAVEAGQTEVTLVPSTDIEGGVNKITNEPIPSFGPGQETRFTLSQGEFLNLETNTLTDATGTLITGDKSILVFGGHRCGGIPNPSTPFCDHLEEQLQPLRTWGNHHIISAFFLRTEADQQMVRILAHNDRTLVQTDPPQNGASSFRLDAGQYVDIQTAQDFEVITTEPVLIGQYIRGVGTVGEGNLGDPAMLMAVPSVQWRTNYDILVPVNYQADFLNIIATEDAEVSIDGQPISGWRPVADGSYKVAIVEVEDGTHKLTSETEFAVVSYGYGDDVSYAFPGGMNLRTIERQ
jgi:hypothetical protein